MESRKSPAICTAEIFNTVLVSLRQGMPLAMLLEKNKDNVNFPTRSCIMAYINADSGRKQNYMQAREDCADSLAEQVVVESDNTLVDPVRSSNRMKARQWLASKIKPKVYGERLDVDVKGTMDVAAAILAARRRVGMDDKEPLTIDNEPLRLEPPVDPFS